MAQHVLSIETPDTLNKCILRIVDTSIYNSMVTPTCLTLEVTLPGFNTATVFTDITTGFINNYTACDLGVQSQDCGTTYASLPDGVYIIKYSVSPNEYVYAEYNHLRMTQALNKVKEVYCDLDLGACEPQEKIREKLNQLTLIERYLDAAKAKVEYCHEPENGMTIYNYAVKLLDKMLCNTCSSSSCNC